MTPLKIEVLEANLCGLNLTERLKHIASICKKPVFTTSLGKEDQVLLSAIAQSKQSINIVTLQTERLFPETNELIEKSKSHFEVNIAEVYPEPEAVENYVGTYGLNGFYESLEARKLCCGVRKIQPLNKVLANADGWITGLTRQQSDGRNQVPIVEYDAQHKMLKFNPIADFSNEKLDDLIEKNEIPINALHMRGYPSIGCEPCTRAVKAGEHPRAGRWWWEQNNSSECGLHTHNLEIQSQK